MKNMIQLLNEQTDLKIKVSNLQQEINDIAFSKDILAIINSSDLFTPEADQLVSLILDRDEPASRAEIAMAFKLSGFDYSESHIDACNPDSPETIQRQVNYYRE